VAVKLVASTATDQMVDLVAVAVLKTLPAIRQADHLTLRQHQLKASMAVTVSAHLDSHCLVVVVAVHLHKDKTDR
jgi:hypothetical protein